MASLNRVTLIGNLGQDPEMRYTSTQIPVVNFSIATTEVRTDQSGNKTEQTSWHRIIVWNKQAENCQKYLAKGRSVMIEGRIQYRDWVDQQGNKRYSTEIVANKVLFLGNKSEGNSTGNYSGTYGAPAGGTAFQPPAQMSASPSPIGDPFADPNVQLPVSQTQMNAPANGVNTAVANSSAAPVFPQNQTAPASAPANVPDLDDIPF